MAWDDDEAKPKGPAVTGFGAVGDAVPRPALPPRDLTILSIDALHGYIAELEAEIARVRQAIAVKEKARAGAESLFRK